MKRREFLKTSSATGAAMLSSGWSNAETLAAEGQPEYYELRVYEMPAGNRRAVLTDYLAKAAIPAWNRVGIKPVGAFGVVSGARSLALYVLIPYPNLDLFQSAPAKLASDADYRKAAAEYMGASIDSPAYTRYESWLLRAFKNVPRLRLPAETAERKPRLFELRVYESHSEEAALKKIDMFNDGGEIALFDRVGLRSVFFGQTLAGGRLPNLVYMTVHQDMAAREKVWTDFGNDPGWKTLRAKPEYANTTSATAVTFLRPTDYSQI